MANNLVSMAVQPLQLEDPVSRFGRVAQVQNMIQQGREHAQRMERTALQIDETKRANAEQEALSEIAHKKAGDIPGFLDEASKHPLIRPQTVAKVRDSFNKAGEAEAKRTAEEAKNREALNNDVVDALEITKALPPEQWQANYEARQKDIAAKWKVPTKELIPFDASDPTFLDSQLARHRTQAGVFKLGAEKRAQTAAEEATAAAQRAVRAEPGVVAAREATTEHTKAETEKLQREADIIANTKPEDMLALVDQIVPPGVKENAALNSRTKAQVQFALARKDLKGAQAAIATAASETRQLEVATDPRVQAAKINVSVASQTAKDRARTPSQEAVDLLAEDALNGKFPSSRNPVLYAHVVERAAALAKERGMTNQQVIMERNAAQANKGALTSLTKQYETLKPFAEMAEKNADILEKAISKVDNLGASFLNTPLREIESRFTGNKDVAAFRAAILPVQADFARILTSPTGSGVLTNESRHEMSQAIKPGATPGEMKAALDIFRQDARNRKDSYEAGIADLKSKSVMGDKPSSKGGTIGTPKTAEDYLKSIGH